VEKVLERCNMSQANSVATPMLAGLKVATIRDLAFSHPFLVMLEITHASKLWLALTTIWRYVACTKTFGLHSTRKQSMLYFKNREKILTEMGWLDSNIPLMLFQDNRTRIVQANAMTKPLASSSHEVFLPISWNVSMYPNSYDIFPTQSIQKSRYIFQSFFHELFC